MSGHFPNPHASKLWISWLLLKLVCLPPVSPHVSVMLLWVVIDCVENFAHIAQSFSQKTVKSLFQFTPTMKLDTREEKGENNYSKQIQNKYIR